jgi:hypothetical protein
LQKTVCDAITRMTTAIKTEAGHMLDPALRARPAFDYQDELAVLEKITGRNLAEWRS